MPTVHCAIVVCVAYVFCWCRHSPETHTHACMSCSYCQQNNQCGMEGFSACKNTHTHRQWEVLHATTKQSQMKGVQRQIFYQHFRHSRNSKCSFVQKISIEKPKHKLLSHLTVPLFCTFGKNRLFSRLAIKETIPRKISYYQLPSTDNKHWPMIYGNVIAPPIHIHLI